MDSTKALLRRSADACWMAGALAGELAALRSAALAGLEPAPGSGIVAGPSHVTRWKHLAAQGVVPAPFESTHFIGGAGLPAWNRSLFEKVAQRYRPGMRVLLILPDPRSGNAVLEEPEIVEDAFADGFTHILRELISPVCDAEMVRRHVAALGYWWAAFGEDLRLVPWTGLLTAHVHLESGEHWQDGQYSYPSMDSWLAGDAARLGAEDISPLLGRDSVAKFGGLYADRSLHPSLAGYVMLMKSAAGVPVSEALAAGQAARDRWLWRLQRRAETLLASTGPVRIAGGAVWQRAARLTLGPAVLSALADAGLAFGGPPEAGVTHVRIRCAGDAQEVDGPATGALRRPLVVPWDDMAALARQPGSTAQDLSAGELFHGSGFGWAELLAEAGAPASWVDEQGEDCPSCVGVAAVLLGLLYGLAMRG